MKKMLLQRNLVFIPVLAMLFFCFMAVPSYAAKKSSKSAPPKVKSAGLSYATTPFDDTWKVLPKNYHGHDIRAVYQALSKKLNLQKDQFETEEQFKQRKQQAWKKTILGNMTADDHFAFIEEAQEKEYDAEKAKFIFKIENFDDVGVVIQSKRTGENRLGQDLAKRTSQNEKRKRRMRGQDTTGTEIAGALLEGAVRAGGVWEVFTVNFSKEDSSNVKNITLDMQPEEARKNKDNIRVLFVGNISGFSSPETKMKGFIPCTWQSLGQELKKIIIYNYQTGEIYRTFDFREEDPNWESRSPEVGMVFVKGGCFQMGDTFGDGKSDDNPVHDVCVSDFYMGKYEVAQGQWKQVTGSSPSSFRSCGDNCPVENVSWDSVQKFIDRLNRISGKRYRLPTEAEWEYAARSGGESEKYAGGSELDDVAWYDGNSVSKTHPVGQKRANGLGLFDMSGNVWEWCSDWYGRDYYKNSPRDNPEGPSSGSNRVIRGGCWFNGAAFARAAYRGRNYPDNRNYYLGFRLVLPAGQ